MKDESNPDWDPFTSSFIPHPSSLFRRSELESNQPFGFFRPALIRLSYPTEEVQGPTSNVIARKETLDLDAGLWTISVVSAARESMTNALLDHESRSTSIGARGETRTHEYGICSPAP